MSALVKRGASLWWMIGLWLTIVGAGSFGLYAYSATPGEGASAPPAWPGGLPFSLAERKLTLVMVAHPRCSCTRASVSELMRLMTDAGRKIDAHVLFLKPDGVEPGWERTDLYDSAARIPGVSVHSDPGGALARRFGVHTSGQVFLYGADAKLRFAGGLTPARSHQGDSVGRHRILAALAGADDRTRSAVYGCSIEEKDQGIFDSFRLSSRSESSSP